LMKTPLSRSGTAEIPLENEDCPAGCRPESPKVRENPDPAALSIVSRAALGVLVASTSMRPFRFARTKSATSGVHARMPMGWGLGPPHCANRFPDPAPSSPNPRRAMWTQSLRRTDRRDDHRGFFEIHFELYHRLISGDVRPGTQCNGGSRNHGRSKMGLPCS
jgi:hypothetical protein